MVVCVFLFFHSARTHTQFESSPLFCLCSTKKENKKEAGALAAEAADRGRGIDIACLSLC